jgi:HSP20 family protein
MAIVKWDPFGELEDVHTRLNRLFGMRAMPRPEAEEPVFTAWSPKVDVQETDKEYLIKADLPDVKKDDVKVEVREGMLTFQGERRQEKEEKGKKFHKIEREYGTFVRRFGLPPEVDASKVQAEFKEGVLSVHLPKASEGMPKAFDVKVS